MSRPSTTSVLCSLTKARIAEIARDFSVRVPRSATKDEQSELLLKSGSVRLKELVQKLGRDELRAACRAHGLDHATRSRPALMAKLLEAHGEDDSVPPKPKFGSGEMRRFTPRPGDIVACRHRQWLVEDVAAPQRSGEAMLVRLVCLDDDNQGRPLEVFWELELGARILQPETHGLGDIGRIDPPRHFSAYLHALKWSAVTATDARLFQAPFRAGIQLMQHQLTPLKRALELPRANLFIADDVGLGKTIEAGLVLQELGLRQQVDFALIVCPASVALQWRDEMASRFGLQFEIYNRSFVSKRRQERGFGVNPWNTHARFIVSYPLLRRPEYFEPLLQRLGDRARKSMLILDEAHTVAPASAHKYAVDSRATRVIRDIAPRFEHRLFLSATPHNGHSNSFSALLEILDPQRFTRGVPVTAAARDAVMVRRLKEDLRELGVEKFPKRQVVRIALRAEKSEWTAEYPGKEPRSIGATKPVELELSALLAEYTELARPEKGRGRLVFVNLQKRLLSSIDAFHRTLSLHAESVANRTDRQNANVDFTQDTSFDDDEYGPDDDVLEAELARETARDSALVQAPGARAKELLDSMLRLASQHRSLPDAKALALVDWIRLNQCSAVKVGGADRKVSAKARAWNERRIIIFTEYGDTKKWLTRLLSAAIEGTDDADERILEFHGGMSDEQRSFVQQAFNGAPSEHAVRILVATDAAREGVNLQGYCADLFHFDVPWNPARMEQRNGRIDRTLQRAATVRCHYFVYEGRPEDVVLDKLVGKVARIQQELGSLSSVVLERVEETMQRGIDGKTLAALEKAEAPDAHMEAVRSDLDGERAALTALRREIDEAGRILESSKNVLEFDPPLLRDAIDVGLELAGIEGRLHETPRDSDSWALPPMPDLWQGTLDSLRAPRERDEALWDWRKKPLRGIVFQPSSTLDESRVHVHLEHPFVQRILARFRAQGFGAHDLSRVTIVRSAHDHVARVIAFGRLSLFGHGAARLHDELIPVAAAWLESRGHAHLKPFADAADRRAVEHLEQLLAKSPSLDGIGSATQKRLCASAAGDFSELWKHVQIEADARSQEAETKLRARARAESDGLRVILESQRKAIQKALDVRSQTGLPFAESDRELREQWANETEHMERRLGLIDRELATEPASIERLYHVALRRLEPIGLVYVWPETRG